MFFFKTKLYLSVTETTTTFFIKKCLTSNEAVTSYVGGGKMILNEISLSPMGFCYFIIICVLCVGYNILTILITVFF